jgi:predicted acylesterase/phospholipase RssA
MKVVLSLPGGGVSGALYQIGAVAALEEAMGGASRLDGYVGHAGGAVFAAALAGGIAPTRLYRAVLDPADPFFPLERHHVLALDAPEWKKIVARALASIGQALPRLDPRKSQIAPVGVSDRILEEMDRIEDSLPAGIFTLDRFEPFLAEFFMKREIPNSFVDTPKPLRVVAFELDTGRRVVFGEESRDTRVSLACAASCALPLFFSPVRIGDSYFVDGGLSSMSHFDVASRLGADFTIVVNPRVPVSTEGRAVPTGHGAGRSVRDKGLLWVFNQSRRIANKATLDREMENPPAGMSVLRIEPNARDAALFLRNPRSFASRRAVLEFAFKAGMEAIRAWASAHPEGAERLGLRV